MNKKLAICVPYRDPGDGSRLSHLTEFVPYLDKFLSDRNFDFKIFVSHQCDDKLFNRSKMKNIAFDIACKEGYDYFAFHDVDMLPEDGADYSYPKDYPIHIATNLSQWNYTLRDIEYFGGCVLFTKEQFEKVNGYYNEYWDWGMEDDDLFWRCVINNMVDRTYIDGPGQANIINFNGIDDYIKINTSRTLRSLVNRSFTMEFLVKGKIPTNIPLYLIGDKDHKYIHFPILSIPGYDFRIAFDNSRAYSATLWNWKNECYYSWIKRYENQWTKLKLVVDDAEKTIRLFMNEQETDTRHGAGSYSPISYKGHLKRYGGSPYFIGIDSKKVFFNGSIAEVKFTNHRNKIILHYTFDEINDNVIIDKSGNENHGYVHGCRFERKNIDKIPNTIVPYRRSARFKCLPHEDLGIVKNKFVQGDTTARNERIYRLKMQEDKINLFEDGIKDMNYKLLNIESLLETRHALINVEC
jgi:hypothetical protein